ncbi:MAG: hypothetical protein AB1705_23645 [Verrucomicrobiota bacterium]
MTESTEAVSSERHALMLENDPQYVREVSALLSSVKQGALTTRKFALARNVAAWRSFTRGGCAGEYQRWING